MIKAFAAQPAATNREITRQLSISINTVKMHLRDIYREVGAGSRGECLLLCLQAGILQPDELCTTRAGWH